MNEFFNDFFPKEERWWRLRRRPAPLGYCNFCDRTATGKMIARAGRPRVPRYLWPKRIIVWCDEHEEAAMNRLRAFAGVEPKRRRDA